MPDVQLDVDGGLEGRKMRLIWRFLLCTGRTGGARVDLRSGGPGSAGDEIYRISGVFLQSGIMAADVPDDF